jgi:acyl-CoA thioester hydrolase
MDNVFYEGQVIWSQLDANQHMRHSAYADVAAQARLNMLEGLGSMPTKLFDLKIGPVLFKEELNYLREISINDYIKVTCEVTSSRADGSRWSFRHEVYRGDGIKAAVILVQGAWIDTVKRKLTPLPLELSQLFIKAPKSADYAEERPKTENQNK